MAVWITGICIILISPFIAECRLYDSPYSAQKPPPPFVFNKKVNDIICPDPEYRCPDDTTCCAGTGSAYACCPLPDAVCCSDRLHCCPSGYACDVKSGACNARTNLYLDPGSVHLVTPARKPLSATPAPATYATSKPIPVQMKTPVSKPRSPAFHILNMYADDAFLQSLKDAAQQACPGGKYSCPDFATCCKTGSGSYACCPFPKATCCDDEQHCCPYGSKCDSAHGSCRRGNFNVPAVKKFPAFPVIKDRNSTVEEKCPDGYPCSDSATCCQISDKQYGCCPMQNAVCCTDRVHCCSKGSKCVSGGCQSHDKTSPWIQVTNTKPSIDDIICPDQQSKCPDNTTCCQRGSQGYGCCPYKTAVCCTDGLHCCPSGYKCDLPHSRCLKTNGTSLPISSF